LITAALEAYIKEGGRFPNDKELDSILKALVDALPETSKMVTKTLTYLDRAEQALSNSASSSHCATCVVPHGAI